LHPYVFIYFHYTPNTIHLSSFFLPASRPHRHLHSFPTRRSSDLSWTYPKNSRNAGPCSGCAEAAVSRLSHSRKTLERSWGLSSPDRKSTRLNSSHLGISYAVFCLKKKKQKIKHKKINRQSNRARL